MADTSGFYKTEDNITLMYGPTDISSLNYDLHRGLYDTYTYPVDGWYWFNSEEEARTFFNIPAPTA